MATGRAGHLPATSPVNVAEIYAGMRAHEGARVARLLGGLEFYPVTVEIGRRAGLLVHSWARRGRRLGVIDSIVAATAIEHELMLMTSNRKDFPMAELKFYPPDGN